MQRYIKNRVFVVTLHKLVSLNNILMIDLEFFNNRRTVRKYNNNKISDSELNKMLEAAFRAPTTGNMQLYSVVVTRSEAGKKALSPAHFNQPSVTGCDVLLTFCADFNRFEKWCKISDAKPGYNNFQSFMTAVIDTLLVAQQFCTIAEMSGLGCCYLGTTTYNAPQISEILKLPKRVVPVTTLTLGYPDGDSPLSDRLSADAIIHRGHYRDYSDEVIKSYYAEKESRDDSRRFVEENGKKSLAQVFTDVRYPKINNEAFSDIYMEFIKNQGY